MSWDELEQVVAPRVLLDAFETSLSDRLRRLGIRHALVGGLAVGHHGHPRATKDVEVIDIFSTTDDPPLQAALVLPDEGEMPIVGVQELVLMKLRAGRPQDVADISQLVRAGADVQAVVTCLRANEPGGVQRFVAIAQEALAR